MGIRAVAVLRPGTFPIRDQGTRPTCLAFTLSDLNRHYSPAPVELSSEYLYRRAVALGSGIVAAGLSVPNALLGIRLGQPPEASYPYQSNEPSSPVFAPQVQLGSPMYSSDLHSVAPHWTSIVNCLSRGKPVGLGILITPTFYYPVDGAVAFVPMTVPDEAHAVVAMGLGTDVAGNYVLVRNSWGAGWGLGGYGWLPEQYIDAHTICAFGRS